MLEVTWFGSCISWNSKSSWYNILSKKELSVYDFVDLEKERLNLQKINIETDTDYSKRYF